MNSHRKLLTFADLSCSTDGNASGQCLVPSANELHKKAYTYNTDIGAFDFEMFSFHHTVTAINFATLVVRESATETSIPCVGSYNTVVYL